MGVEGLMKREVAGPLPFFISGVVSSGCEGWMWLYGELTDCLHGVGHFGCGDRLVWCVELVIQVVCVQKISTVKR